MIPNPMNNTVDITYNVEEKANSQLELSGGWGNNTFVGTLGVSFNNFSTYNFFRKRPGDPFLGRCPAAGNQIPDQRFILHCIYGKFRRTLAYRQKPTSLNISAYFTRQTNSYATYYYQVLNDDEYMEIFGAAVGLGTRLKWPDNYFVLYNQLGWQSYRLQDWSYNFIFDTGISHNISWTTTLTRNSTDQSIYPRSGSDLSFSVQVTPPFSLMGGNRNKDYSNMTVQDHYKWIEYHKWTFRGSLFTKLVGDLVLMTRAQFGYLGFITKTTVTLRSRALYLAVTVCRVIIHMALRLLASGLRKLLSHALHRQCICRQCLR